MFYSATSLDYVLAAVITLPLAAIGQFAIAFIGLMMGFLVIFIGPMVGGLISEIVWRVTGKRRGQYTWLVVAACMVIAALPSLLASLLPFILSFQVGGELARVGLYRLMGFIWPVVYLVLAAGTAIARLKTGK